MKRWAQQVTMMSKLAPGRRLATGPPVCWWLHIVSIQRVRSIVCECIFLTNRVRCVVPGGAVVPQAAGFEGKFEY